MSCPENEICDENYYRYVGWPMSENAFDRSFFLKTQSSAFSKCSLLY